MPDDEITFEEDMDNDSSDEPLFKDTDHALSAFFHSYLSLIPQPERAQLFALSCALSLSFEQVEDLVNTFDSSGLSDPDGLEDPTDEAEVDEAVDEEVDSLEDTEDSSEKSEENKEEQDELEDDDTEESAGAESETAALGDTEGLPAEDEIQEALQTDGEDVALPDPDDLAIQNDGDPVTYTEKPDDSLMFDDGEPVTSSKAPIVAKVTYF